MTKSVQFTSLQNRYKFRKCRGKLLSFRNILISRLIMDLIYFLLNKSTLSKSIYNQVYILNKVLYLKPSIQPYSFDVKRQVLGD